MSHVNKVAMRPSRIWIAAFVVVIAAACGDGTSDAPTSASPAGSGADVLAGTSWVTQRISDNSGEPRVPAGNAPTIEFDADGRTVSGSTGCNVYSGNATIGRGTISVTQVAVTDRACTPQEIMEQETLFLEILNRADQFTLGDRMLELIGVGGSVSLIESVPVTDATLDGTAWVLDSLIDGEVAMSILTTTTPSLTLDTGEGSIQGTTGCNTFSGTVMIDSSGFTVTDMNWTEIGCEPDIMRQETLILDVLQNAERYQIEGDRLTISSTQGRSLIYRTG